MIHVTYYIRERRAGLHWMHTIKTWDAKKMPDLYCAPLVDLIDRMRLEFKNQASIFDLPARRWYTPPPDTDAPDLSVRFHDQLAGTPVGPASGPQTQMAQNLVLSWLAGSRILELKTVQIDDELTIGRPCIDATNVGYNIEFSQELLTTDSLDQYVQGAMLIHMLREAPDAFGHPFGDADLRGRIGATVFDMSIGYDLAGIQSAKVRRFIEGMIDARETVARLRDEIPKRLGALRDLDFPTELSRSITLSTFHGCPADEIERICEFLLREMNVDTIVKMNPPMLGRERLEHLLYDVMGYEELRVVPAAYTNGLQFDESIAMCGRLTALANSLGRRFGAKFSNTLEVVNHRDFFPPTEKVMYLSGAPLHVITLALTDMFRQAVGPATPISFSAGVDQKNFANMVACGFRPVTTCTDLLKVGGYGRLPAYLLNLEKEMLAIGAATIDEFILDARGHREEAADDVALASWLNTTTIARETEIDERYWKTGNAAIPKRIDSHLELFDCITCNKCIPVCPNDANFLYETPEVDFQYRDIEVSPKGVVTEVGEEKSFRLKQDHQIANFADFCNECGNCDTFCPEWDGPYIKKPSFYGSRRAFDDGAPRDGFLVEGTSGQLSMTARIDGRLYCIEETGDKEVFRFNDGDAMLLVNSNGELRFDCVSQSPPTHRVDMGKFHALRTLLIGITNRSRVHQVNTRLLANDV